jgi:transcriptional regulator with XRE-family HTH domain
VADLQQTLGAVIRRERRERNLTLKELAGRSALSVVYLSEIERGKKYPSASVLESVSGALHLEVPDLLERLATALRATPATLPQLPEKEPAGAETARGAVTRHAPISVEREESHAAGTIDREGITSGEHDRPELAIVSPDAPATTLATGPKLHLLAA